MRESKILRTVGQFQLKSDAGTDLKIFYVENTILTKQGKESKSYKFGNDRKDTMMLVSDAEFVSRAIQCAGNDISEVITAPTTLEDFKEIEKTLLGLIINPHADEKMIRSLKVRLAVCQAKISELEKE